MFQKCSYIFDEGQGFSTTLILSNSRISSLLRSTLGTSLSSYSARLLKHPETVLNYEDARATMYDWLHSMGEIIVVTHNSPGELGLFNLKC